MKKYFVFAATVIALAACSSEEENVQSWNGEIRLSAVNVVQTRAAQGIQSTAFDEGEKIDVFINEDGESSSGGYEQPVVYKSGTGGVLTTDETQYYPQSNGVNIFAVYPSGVAGTNVNATNVAFAVESDQSEEDAYKASDLMVGAPANNPVSKTSGTVQLTFKHCLSKININISAGDGITETDLQGATVLQPPLQQERWKYEKTLVFKASVPSSFHKLFQPAGSSFLLGTVVISRLLLPSSSIHYPRLLTLILLQATPIPLTLQPRSLVLPTGKIMAIPLVERQLLHLNNI